jgi:hypothetical protein
MSLDNPPISNRKSSIGSFSLRYVLCSMRFLCLPLFLLVIVHHAFAQEKIAIHCEVMEVSKHFSTSSNKLTGISYILLHHAHSEDREVLSKWLKTYSGTEVTFIVNQKEHKGVLFRLDHCFGRGLLIYEGDAEPGERDIIQVILSPHP